MKLKRDAGPNPSIRVSKETYRQAMFKKTLKNVLIIILILFALYLGVAAVMMRVVPSSAGMIPVKNNTYSGGELPDDSQALISLKPGEDPVKTGPMDRLQQAFIPQKPTALVSVKAGPFGKISWVAGIFTVDGQPITSTIKENSELKFLENQYVGICISGDCAPGTALIFHKDKVMGIPLKQDAVVPPEPAPKVDPTTPAPASPTP